MNDAPACFLICRSEVPILPRVYFSEIARIKFQNDFLVTMFEWPWVVQEYPCFEIAQERVIIAAAGAERLHLVASLDLVIGGFFDGSELSSPYRLNSLSSAEAPLSTLKPPGPIQAATRPPKKPARHRRNALGSASLKPVTERATAA